MLWRPKKKDFHNYGDYCFAMVQWWTRFSLFFATIAVLFVTISLVVSLFVE